MTEQSQGQRAIYKPQVEEIQRELSRAQGAPESILQSTETFEFWSLLILTASLSNDILSSYFYDER